MIRDNILPFTLGIGSGAGVGYMLGRFYNEPIPWISNYIPSPYNRFSTLGMFLISGFSLIGSLFTRGTLKSSLFGLAIGAVISGLYNSFSVEQARAKMPKLRVRRPVVARSKTPSLVGKDPFIQAGSIPIRQSGLLGGVSQKHKYSHKEIIA